MTTLRTGLYYQAIITEWEGSKSHVVLRKQGKEEVEVYYSDGVKIDHYFNQYGEIKDKEIKQYTMHTVSERYVNEELKPLILGLTSL